VRRDGTTVRGMPSDSFYATTDADLGDLIAYLRSVEPASDALPETEVRYMGRLGLATGKYRLAPQILATSPRRRETLSPGDAISFGRYIAYTTCVECHGEKLMGDPRSIEPSPSLAIVASYEPAEFARLMKDGITATGKSPKLMGGVARARFAHLTTEEVDALYQYLSLLADPSAADRL